jgi:hypothetical protein
MTSIDRRMDRDVAFQRARDLMRLCVGPNAVAMMQGRTLMASQH